MVLYFLFLSIIEIAVVYSRRSGKQCNDPDFENNPNYKVEADRVYYLGCIEMEWDYIPTGMNVMTGQEITSESPEAKWVVGNGVDRIGGKYWKALYREYTDCTFKKQKKRTEEEAHLGTLGPNIRALTGERIAVFYKNMCSIDTTIHAHGVLYGKLSEGAFYVDPPDGINGGDLVKADGGKWIYIWYARHNMIDEGTSSKMWIYHGHRDEPREVNAGLFGSIIITKKGKQTSSTDLKPKDVDREFVTAFVSYDENDSSLFKKNLEFYFGEIPSDELLNDEEFFRSNVMHSINGLMFGNLVDLKMYETETVRWYTVSYGTDLDGPHSPHWHGNIVLDTLGDNTDTLVLIPGTTYTVTMTIDNPGYFFYHCHIHDHIDGGMYTGYTVYEKEKKPCDDKKRGSKRGGIWHGRGSNPAKQRINHQLEDIDNPTYIENENNSYHHDAFSIHCLIISIAFVLMVIIAIFYVCYHRKSAKSEVVIQPTTVDDL